MVQSIDSDALNNISGTVVLAGAGKMGGALLTGWLARGLNPKRVAVIEPHPSDDIRALAARGIRLNPAAKEAGAVAALVVAVKPQAFGDAGPALRPLIGPSTLVVSIMAGTTIAVLDAVCGGNIVRAMPNTPAAIGRGITVDGGNIEASLR
jgi:pyrroline-5-carboxylate reductase